MAFGLVSMRPAVAEIGRPEAARDTVFARFRQKYMQTLWATVAGATRTPCTPDARKPDQNALCHQTRDLAEFHLCAACGLGAPARQNRTPTVDILKFII